MPPRIKISKEDILDAAIAVVREQGAPMLNARTLAAALHCSTQPIFSNFATMDDLRAAVAEQAENLYRTFQQDEVSSGRYPLYKATGMAYIRFAKEEKELFKLLFMCDRSGASTEDSHLFDEMQGIVQENTGLQSHDAKLFHLEMWAYVHGIATMFATKFLELDTALVSNTISDVYQGLRKQHGLEG